MRTAINIVFLFLMTCFGVPALLASLFSLSTKLSDQIYILGSDEKELISLSANYINSFKATNHRLPTYSEYDHWAASQPQDTLRFEGKGFSLATKYPEDLILKFGTPPVDGYVLNFWGGDSWLSYISWHPNRSVAYVPDNEYFSFGNKIRSAAIYFAIPAFIAALWLYALKISTASKK